MLWTGRGNLKEVRNGSEELRGGLGWVRGLSKRFETGRTPSGKPETGWRTLREVRDGSGDLGEVRDGL